MKAYRRVIVFTVAAIVLLLITLANELGATDTTSNIVEYSLYDSTSSIIGETYKDGKMYDVVETVRVTRHLRVKPTGKKNRYELKLNLDK